MQLTQIEPKDDGGASMNVGDFYYVRDSAGKVERMMVKLPTVGLSGIDFREHTPWTFDGNEASPTVTGALSFSNMEGGAFNGSITNGQIVDA